MSNEIKNVTVTIIFEGSALNRDEKIGGNIQSVKKLNIKGQLHTFISKYSFRHFLFETLQKSDGWEAAPVAYRGKNKKTIQFDLSKADILTHPELDAFGYMFTGDPSITRKAPVGITKAVSLFPYEQDMAFYANHDMVERRRQDGNEQNPNPFNKEEHTSLYKVSLTIDADMFGKDVWIIDEDECNYNNESGKLEIVLDEDDTTKKISCTENDDGDLSLTRDGNDDKQKGTIKIESIGNRNTKKQKVTFLLDNKEKKKRVRQILQVIRNGLYYQSAGEANTIIPLFFSAASVKIPSPVLHSYIDISKEDGTTKVTGVSDALNNGWIKGKIYIQDCERLRAVQDEEVEKDWKSFLQSANIKENNE